MSLLPLFVAKVTGREGSSFLMSFIRWAYTFLPSLLSEGHSFRMPHMIIDGWLTCQP